jgi:hypothetical protein
MDQIVIKLVPVQELDVTIMEHVLAVSKLTVVQNVKFVLVKMVELVKEQCAYVTDISKANFVKSVNVKMEVLSTVKTARVQKIMMDFCEKPKCQQGRKTLDRNSIYSCNCFPNYGGVFCENCLCENGGTCAFFGCECPLSFEGDFCEQPKCQNGERTNFGDSLVCTCPDPYEGVFCEIEKSENNEFSEHEDHSSISPGYILIIVGILAILILVIVTMGIKFFGNFTFKF